MTPTVTLRDDGKALVLRASPRDRDLIRQIPGARYSRSEDAWTVPATWGASWVMRSVFGDRLLVDPAVTLFVRGLYENKVRPALELRQRMEDTLDPDEAEVVPYLWPYQVVGVKFLLTAEHVLLGDEMGTGKTVQAIAAYRLARWRKETRPALIVAPNSMLRTWADEFARWWPEAEVVVVRGSAAKRRKLLAQEADAYIIGWEALRRHTRLAPYGSVHVRGCSECIPGSPVPPKQCEREPRELNEMEFGVVIFDEAHRAKDPKAKQTRAAWAVAHQQECLRWALTGTPVANSPGDLWSILHLVAPDEWPSRTRYLDRYCETAWNIWGGMEIVGLDPHHEEEFRKIFEPMFLRRPKEAVLSHLPPKVYSRRYAPMSPKQARAYRQMETEMVALLSDDEAVVATSPLTAMIRLSQFAAAYAELDDAGEVRLSEPSGKLDVFEEVWEDAGRVPAVVFAESRQLLRLLEERLKEREIDYGIVAGDIPPEMRAVHVQRFNAGEVPLMLVTVGAGGEGLTLRAPMAVFLQRPWSLVQSRQAEDRVHRPGAEVYDKIDIIDIVTEGTVEERRFEALGDKEEMLEQVVRDRETVLRLIGGGS